MAYFEIENTRKVFSNWQRKPLLLISVGYIMDSKFIDFPHSKSMELVFHLTAKDGRLLGAPLHQYDINEPF